MINYVELTMVQSFEHICLFCCWFQFNVYNVGYKYFKVYTILAILF